jgi:Fe2+ or Zn2+ uptake regulation protein
VRAPTYHATSGELFHLVCRDCCRVISVEADDMEAALGTLAGRYGFLPETDT